MAAELEPRGVAAIAITPAFSDPRRCCSTRSVGGELAGRRKKDGNSSSPNRPSSSGGPWRRWRRIRRSSTDRVSCSARGAQPRLQFTDYDGRRPMGKAGD